MNDGAAYDEPLYYISVVAKMVELHPQTLRHYERLGLVVPQRSGGNIRLYSDRDVERLQKINRLTSELGINLAGAEVILRLLDRIDELQQQRELVQREFEREVSSLRTRLAEES